MVEEEKICQEYEKTTICIIPLDTKTGLAIKTQAGQPSLDLDALIKDEADAAKHYHELGFHALAVQEERHKDFLQKLKEEIQKKGFKKLKMSD